MLNHCRPQLATCPHRRVHAAGTWKDSTTIPMNVNVRNSFTEVARAMGICSKRKKSAKKLAKNDFNFFVFFPRFSMIFTKILKSESVHLFLATCKYINYK
uniref:Uncharacterized protein n=1 Tax=Romanomermis culicivorax TaxID=13658 RepID=A0A915L4A4_ROMCU